MTQAAMGPAHMDAAPVHASREVRFEFGENWSRFLRTLDDSRIQQAEESLKKGLGMENLQGKRFLDMGSGSGLFSVAARRLGARVHSFDCDAQAVACTLRLKQIFFPEDSEWSIEQGSALDRDYLKSLGKFDIVYSWGVLHHCGDMWKALDLTTIPASEFLMISIYNDQAGTSRRWRFVKRHYNTGGFLTKKVLQLMTWFVCWGMYIVIDLAIDCIRLQPMRTIRLWRSYGERGMSAWHDLVDWAGGYPFEVAKPEQVFEFFKDRGFHLERLKTCGGGKGCNEFLFIRGAL